jgi:hypothetical protein
MENEVLKEIKALRVLLSQLIGTSDLPAKEKFSKEAIMKANVEFKKLSIERGEWVPEHEISKIIRKSPYYPGKFIIEKFCFSNYFKRGKSLYFNRKDLIALNKELKARNINLGQYIEFENDRDKFLKHLETIKEKGTKRKRFIIPDDLKNIQTSPYNHPPKEIIMNHIQSLKDEFQKFKLTEYIDIYNDNYAMFKFIYHFDRYLNNDLKKRCKDWCFQFNYANEALKAINKIKSETIY